jgi:hypothetical protein
MVDEGLRGSAGDEVKSRGAPFVPARGGQTSYNIAENTGRTGVREKMKKKSFQLDRAVPDPKGICFEGFRIYQVQYGFFRFV